MPYPGFATFRREDYGVFFGREIQVIQMLRQLEVGRFLAIVGSSGCGKSSLVMAGLLPAIRKGFLHGTKDWVVVPPVKPGHDPYRQLASTLARCAAPADLPTRHNACGGQTTEEFIETLRETDKGLLAALAKLVRSSGRRPLTDRSLRQVVRAARRPTGLRGKPGPRTGLPVRVVGAKRMRKTN
jgi:energy-coupling factor transporter ATP-binding protein EcfA2